MRRRIYIHDHETLASLARKYPGRSIRWMRDRPAAPVVMATPHYDAFHVHHIPASAKGGRWHRQA